MRSYLSQIQKHLKYIDLQEFEYDINVSLKYKYIYIETPKVGCSTIKDTLQRMELEFPELARDDPNDIHRRKYSPLLSPSQTCDFDRLLENPEFLVFCFVRNPYTRLLSAYLEKIVEGKWHKKSILAAMNEDTSNLSKAISFREFVDVVCDLAISDMDLHWRTQYYQTYQDSISYGFIGRFESFQEDCSYVFSKIRDDYERYFRSERRHATSSNELILNFYDEKLQEKVFNKFKIDFEYFGYGDSLPVC